MKKDMGKNIDNKEFMERRQSFEKNVDTSEKRDRQQARTKDANTPDYNKFEEKFHRQQADYGVNKRS